jgi:hypothetical protein
LLICRARAGKIKKPGGAWALVGLDLQRSTGCYAG